MAKKKKKDPILASIEKAMKKAMSAITKPITQVIKYFKCGINKIVNLPKCIIFYILDIIIATYFMFWNIIASLIPGLKGIGKIIWKSLEILDKYIYKFTGIHIIHYSKTITKRCYLC